MRITKFFHLRMSIQALFLVWTIVIAPQAFTDINNVANVDDIDELRQSAEAGDAAAQFELGRRYDLAKGVEEDDEKAVEWYRKAAEQGDADAQFNLALMYEDGEGVEEDQEKAVEWYRKAAEQGDAAAQLNLGSKYGRGKGVKKDQEKAVEWYRKAADQGNAKAQLVIGLRYGSGLGVEEDTITSFEYLRLAYKQDNFKAGVDMAEVYLDQESTFYSPKRAYDILTRLSSVDMPEDETADSLALLGSMYLDGQYIQKDLAKAFEYLSQLQPQSISYAALKSVVSALLVSLNSSMPSSYALQSLPFLDEFCKTSLVRTDILVKGISTPFVSLFRDAEFSGEDLVRRCRGKYVATFIASEDYYSLSLLLRSGITNFLMEDKENAFKYMLMAAESSSSKDNAPAMDWISLFYGDGYGVNKDDLKALYWRKKAADLGYSYALNNLGWAYEKGELGLERDMTKAQDYYRKSYAEDKDCGICMTNLGRMFELESSSQDLVMSKILYSKAFDLGDLEAGNLLAALELGAFADSSSIEEAKSILEVVVMGNADFRMGVGKESHDEEVDKARKQLLALRALDKANDTLDLGSFHALVIGNTNYDDLDDLTTAQRDASDVAKILEKDYGFTVELLLDATRQKTLEALNRFRRDLQKSDNFLLYYAGHGVLDETKEGFWQPTDAATDDDTQWIANKRINSILKKFKANNIILVADSCYAGSQFRGLIAIDEQLDDSVNSSQSSESLAQRLSNSTSRVAITSGGLEPVADRIGFSDNSVFAESFIKVLENNSEIITSGEIFKRVRQRVVPITADAGLEQTPEFGKLWASGHEGGDFVFSRTR